MAPTDRPIATGSILAALARRAVMLALFAAVLFLVAPIVLPLFVPEARGAAQVPAGGLRFDPLVTLGNVLTIIAFAVSLIAAWFGFRSRVEVRLAVIETKLDTIWRAWVRDHKRDDSWAEEER